MNDLFIYMLKWACCLTLLYSLYRLLLSKETFHRVNRIVLLGILVFSMLLPLLTVPLNRPVKINVWQTEEKEKLPQLPIERDARVVDVSNQDMNYTITMNFYDENESQTVFFLGDERIWVNPNMYHMIQIDTIDKIAEYVMKNGELKK